jgi:hypothetical protein
MGGGGGAYTGYTIPAKLASNADASFTAGSISAASITFTGTSMQGYGTVVAVLDSTGRLGTFSGTLYTQ